MKKVFLALVSLMAVSAYSQKVIMVHNSPDPDAAVVDVWVHVPIAPPPYTDMKVIDDFPFRNAFVYELPAAFGTLPPGTQVELRIKDANSAGASDPDLYVETFATGLPAGDNFYVLSGEVNNDFKINVFSAQIGSATAGSVSLGVFNGAQGLANLTMQSFITTIQSVPRDTIADNLTYDAFSGYADAAAAPRRLHSYVTGTNAQFYEANGDILKNYEDYSVTAFASGYKDTTGTNGGKPYGLFFLPLNSSTVASTGSGEPLLEFSKEKVAGLVQVYHDAADPELANVDLYVGGIKQVIGISFTKGFESAGFIQDFDYEIGIAKQGGSTKELTTTLRFGDDSVVAVLAGVLNETQFAANPDGKDIKLDLFSYDPARETAPTGTTRVLFFNGVTDAASMSVYVPAASMELAPATAYSEFNQLGVGGTEDIPTSFGTVVVDLKLTDGTVFNSYQIPLTSFDGKAITVFTSGFVNPSDNQNGSAFKAFAGVPASPFPSIIELGVVSSVVNPATADLSFRMFPNPASAELTMGFDVKDESNISIDILDLNGKVVKSVINDTFVAGTNYLTQDVRDLSTGLYLARVKSGNATSVYKFNIVH